MTTTRQSERGSALMLTVVVVVIVMGLSAAMLSENLFSTKTQAESMSSEEAQLICDAALDRARQALFNYRKTNDAAWSALFAWSRTCEDKTPGGDSNIPLFSSNVVKDPLTGKETSPQGDFILNWKLTSPERIAEEYATDPTVQVDKKKYNMLTDANSTIPTNFADLFCKLIPFNRGAYHVVLVDNDDQHGDGIDHDGDGELYDVEVVTDPVTGAVILDETPDPATFVSDPLIDGDRQAFLIVTAVLPNGTMRQNVVLVSFPPRKSSEDDAVKTNGSAVMGGAYAILGTKGSIHVGENLSGNGGNNAVVAVSADAVGTNTLTMANPPPDGINSGVAPKPVPALDIPFFSSPDFEHAAHVVILKKNGTIQKGAAVSGATFPFTSNLEADGTRTWKLSGNTTPTSAIYYVEGNFQATGQGNATPYKMSVVAEGNVHLGGNVSFSAYEVNGVSTQTLVLAGKDVRLQGTGGVGDFQYAGIVWSNEQVTAKGNFKLNGALIGGNVTDSPGSWVSNQSGIGPDLAIQGNPTIIFNGGSTFVPPANTAVSVESVRRTR